MDNKDLGSVWRAVLGELELSVSQAHYKTWLKTTNLEALEDSQAIVSVPNIFTKNLVARKYSGLITDTLTKLVPNVSSVEYKIGSSANNHTDQINNTLLTSSGQNSQHKTTTSVETAEDATSSEASPNHNCEKYNFGNFVVGGGNRLAFAAAKHVAEKPGEHYNPLFLYGPAGVGKTHLMWGIIAEIMDKYPKLKTLYVTSEDFISSFISAVSKGRGFGGGLTDRFRKVDILLVDDMQFIAGKEKTQEEFFHTFNSLHQANKQIVICSDRPPKAIATLEERLRSRFEWGMVADIQPPDLETRTAILISKANAKKIDLPIEVANFFAESVESNIRELEGALNRVVAYSYIHQSPITLEIAEEVLGSSQNLIRRSITPKVVISQVASFYDLKPSDLTSSKRNKQIALPRQVAMYIMREGLGMSFPQIATSLGKRDHTTVIHGVKKVHSLCVSNQPVTEEIKILKQKMFNS